MRWVYSFGGGEAEGGRGDRALLGSKGAQLGEMSRIGLNVPPGFTISTEACRVFLKTGAPPPDLWAEVERAMAELEVRTGKRFGDDVAEPLLVSVRSGAAVSMPGMMDTVLNLGSNQRTVAALARAAGGRFAWDCYRRFAQLYGEVVSGVPHDTVERALAEARSSSGAAHEAELGQEASKTLVNAFLERAREAAGHPVPDDPWEQLREAVLAVFRSWDTERARDYRRVHRIPEDLGTGVNVMTMVYGNRDENSASGVAFTRDPASGDARLYGEFLANAQGEDVVAGTRDPLPIADLAKRFPRALEELEQVRRILESHYRDMQDLEFTVERGELYILQTRTGKRTGRAAVKIAVDMADEGLIDRPTAILRVDSSAIEQILHPSVDPSEKVEELARGLPASPGAASGRVVFSSKVARTWKERGEQVVLVRTETSADDFSGMVASSAIVTARGGMTSHAAVVARGMGRCCVVGCSTIAVDEEAGRFVAGGRTVSEGDVVTVDGSGGRVLLGAVPLVEASVTPELERFLSWADAVRTLGVRANADAGADAARARELGAEGVGLCRTEHMFFGKDRLGIVRELIVARDEHARASAVERLSPIQQADFESLFRAMDGLPVTIRLLDPPLHEFLPKDEAGIDDLAKRTNRDPEELAAALERMREVNPMLGHRGVRVGVTFPEVTAMQARAVFRAALAVSAKGVVVRPEIMMPLVCAAEELVSQREVVERVAREVFDEAGRSVPFEIGTMIELPRAALTARSLAAHADFFSFGTNDLTQTTLGLSRDDSGTFLPKYLEEGILKRDPFRSLDVDGVGRLVSVAIEEGREAKPVLVVGVCGEHGGDPDSVAFFHRAGVSYVSCSPFRVPVARVAAAQAALRASGGGASIGDQKPQRPGYSAPGVRVAARL